MSKQTMKTKRTLYLYTEGKRALGMANPAKVWHMPSKLHLLRQVIPFLDPVLRFSSSIIMI